MDSGCTPTSCLGTQRALHRQVSQPLQHLDRQSQPRGDRRREQIPLRAWLLLGIRRGSGRIPRGFVDCRRTRRWGSWSSRWPGRGDGRMRDQGSSEHSSCRRHGKIEGHPQPQGEHRQLIFVSMEHLVEKVRTYLHRESQACASSPSQVQRHQFHSARHPRVPSPEGSLPGAPLPL